MGLYDNLSLEPTEQTIRLMRLQTAPEHSSPLIAELFVVALETNPQYAALSYCWGSPTPTSRLICNNTELDVRENLGLALSSIRSTSDLPLWVDSICINQDNLRERSAQVAIMTRIYSQATQTFAYLGEPDSDAMDEACKILATLSIPVLEKREWDSDNFNLKPRFRARVTAIKLALQHPRLAKRAYDKDIKRALSRLMDRPYFTRKWIIQEVVRSGSLFCLLGLHRFEWKTFLLTVVDESHNDHATPNMANICRVLWLWALFHDYTYQRTSSLLTLLYYSRSYEATEPRDHVFALLGAASDSNDFPNPNHEIAVEQIYREISSCFIQQGKGFLMLHLVGIKQTDNGLPSWVVDWRDLDTFYPRRYFASFRAGGNNGCLKLSTDTAKIIATVKIVDRIAAIGDPFSDELNLWDRLTQYIEDCALAFEDFYSNSTGRLAVQEDLASLIYFEMRFKDVDPDRRMFMFNEDYHDTMRCVDVTAFDSVTGTEVSLMFLRYDRDRFAKWLSKMCRRMGAPGLGRRCQKIMPIQTPRILAEHKVIEGLDKSSGEEHCLRLNFFHSNTRPIMTQNRRLGLAPALTQKDDIVCVILGTKAPFILRPCGDDTYKIVGEAYVRGIMFGEALSDDRYPSQEIVIC